MDVCYKGDAMNEIRRRSLLHRITRRPDVFGGRPIIRDQRLAVDHVLSLLAAGETPESVVNAYPYLERDDVTACLLFAAEYLGNDQGLKDVTGKQPREAAFG